MKKISRLLFGFFAALVFITGTASAAHAQVYIYANNGGYYTAYGPAQYWYNVDNEGYCGNGGGACSPNNMKYTWSGCSLSNYAQWTNGAGSSANAQHDAYIPGTNATNTAAPYMLSYAGGSQYHFTINQNAYYDAFVKTRPGTPWFSNIGSVWLDDNPCNGTSKIGFDEQKITY